MARFARQNPTRRVISTEPEHPYDKRREVTIGITNPPATQLKRGSIIVENLPEVGQGFHSIIRIVSAEVVVKLEKGSICHYHDEKR